MQEVPVWPSPYVQAQVAMFAVDTICIVTVKGVVPFCGQASKLADGGGAKFAVTFLSAFIVMVAGLTNPLASPLQLLKAYPLLAFAVNVTTVPAVYCVPALQFGAGLAFTFPLPLGFTPFVNV